MTFTRFGHAFGRALFLAALTVDRRIVYPDSRILNINICSVIANLCLTNPSQLPS